MPPRERKARDMTCKTTVTVQRCGSADSHPRDSATINYRDGLATGISGGATTPATPAAAAAAVTPRAAVAPRAATIPLVVVTALNTPVVAVTVTAETKVPAVA